MNSGFRALFSTGNPLLMFQKATQVALDFMALDFLTFWDWLSDITNTKGDGW